MHVFFLFFSFSFLFLFSSADPTCTRGHMSSSRALRVVNYVLRLRSKPVLKFLASRSGTGSGRMGEMAEFTTGNPSVFLAKLVIGWTRGCQPSILTGYRGDDTLRRGWTVRIAWELQVRTSGTQSRGRRANPEN